ncbi:MAG: efflux RND transporter periplasmic adaptor subunit [Proteobacteria bacterium]|nr:efflux RND transporter periplasmic adaptor subunit [Pseudomonadota bacterium]
MVESDGLIRIVATTSGKVTYSLNNLKSGTTVEKGELLVAFDSRHAENSLNIARAELVKSVAAFVPQFRAGNISIYEKWNDYLNSLDFSYIETPPLPKITDSREKLLISTYGIYTTFYNVKNAELALENYEVIAPFSGNISGSGILVESFVNSGQPLCTLVDVKNLKVSVPLTVDDLSKIDSSTETKVKISPLAGNGSVLYGKVVSSDSLMDSSSQMIKVFVDFTNPEMDPAFVPGNYVDIEIEGCLLLDAAAVPRHAVVDNRYVYTFEEKKLEKREVSILAVSNNTVFIKNTLPEGSEIITTILKKPLIGMKLSNPVVEDEGKVAEADNGGNNEKDS